MGGHAKAGMILGLRSGTISESPLEQVAVAESFFAGPSPMPPFTHDDWDDDDDATDDASPGFGDEDEEPTVPCPYCRREILEDTPRCPYCERYISTEDGSASARVTQPTWVILTALVCLAMALAWALGVL
jgi:hypothetical protein